MTILDLSAPESRYDRQERITWWDQAALARGRVLVVGAGALGNEIVKNLALVGVGSIDILDMDFIERSNLARCGFFREVDEGKAKSETLALAAALINPECRIQGFVTTVQEFGSGSLLDYDVIIAGLDNIEARLWINKHARRLGKFWIDGAIEGLQGIARTFPPTGACLECTLNEQDHINISHRRSCALLSPEELISGKTPTNATTASVIAGIEVQEAIKILVGRHDLLAIQNKVWRMDGETMLTSLMSFSEDEYCLAHDSVEVSEPEVDFNSGWDVAIKLAEQISGETVVAIDFEDDVIEIHPCGTCENGVAQVGLRSLFRLGAGKCDLCNTELVASSKSSFLPTELSQGVESSNWFWPNSEVVSFRTIEKTISLILRKENRSE